MRKYPAYPIIFMLIISVLANGLSLSFRGEVFTHELDHMHQELSSDHATHLELNRHPTSNDSDDLDTATHLCLHFGGHYQPFFFNSFPQIPVQAATEVLTVFISSIIPETILDLPLRPPRSVS